MKKFIANISRIIITYSKFLIMIMLLSSSDTPVKAEDSFTYLKCGVDYLRLTGNYISSNYNIRTKKFLNSYTIKQYGETWIYANNYSLSPSYIRLNRNTGEKNSGSSKIACKKINFAELPKLDDEGKKF